MTTGTTTPTSTTPEVAISVRGLSKSFGERRILDNVDLEIHKGETLVILGGSGSGKSTLLRCLVGLEQPDAGTVEILGTDLFRCPPHKVDELRQRIGMAFQNGALFGSMTVAQNVDLPLRELTRLPASTRRIIVRIKLALVGLEDALDRYPAQLSGGMQKRAAFARATALDPDFLFCDEPSAGLDPITAAGLDRLLVRLCDVFGMTLVVVTHELESAFAIADRIALLDRGRFLITGSKDEVRDSEDPRVRRFLDRRPDDEMEDGLRYEKLIRIWEQTDG